MGNLMDKGAWQPDSWQGVLKSQTWLSTYTHTYTHTCGKCLGVKCTDTWNLRKKGHWIDRQMDRWGMDKASIRKLYGRIWLISYKVLLANSFNFAVCLKLHNILFFWKKNVSTKFHILNGANFFQTYKASLEEGRPQTQVNISWSPTVCQALFQARQGIWRERTQPLPSKGLLGPSDKHTYYWYPMLWSC